MSQAAEVRPGSARSLLSPSDAALIRWVCTSNPFYVLSALLVCLGLWVSFGGQAEAASAYALLSGMAGYTLLLAATAVLLVRLVAVWDDVRTVMLLVVLMFLATSVTFDEVLARAPSRGVACYLGGLLFAAAVSEGMLRGTRLRMPALFRGPYYLILGLFFLYPAALTPLLDQPRSEALAWALFGFTPAAGLVALTLIPAARRGRVYARDNGSPWRWAWYPWTPFGLLALAVPARSALLCWSMHHVPLGAGEPYLFGPYFLAPLALGVGAVLFEIGRAEGLRGVTWAALAAPAFAVGLSLIGHRQEDVYREFLGLFSQRLGGTPPFVALVAAAGFYAYAAARRTPAAVEFLTLALAGLVFIGPTTLVPNGLGPDGPVAAQPGPILAIGLLQLALGVRRRGSGRCLVGAIALALAVAVALPGGVPRGPAAFGLIALATLAVGAAFEDDFARRLRDCGAAALLAASLVALTGRVGQHAAVPTWAPVAAAMAMAVLLVGYGLALRHRTSLTCAGLIGLAWLVANGWAGYLGARRAVAGLDYLAVGMALFALAVLTSVGKAGLLTRGKAGRGPKPLATLDLLDGEPPPR